MAVLIEGISVVVRRDALEDKYPGGSEGFINDAPNQTICADPELARVGFLSPADVKAFIEKLERYGLVHLLDGKALDLVVVDQIRGPTTPCDWIEFGTVSPSDIPSRKVKGCRLKGSTITKMATPIGWTWENSLSAQYGFVPTGHEEKSLRFLRHENGLDVYLNLVTGKKVYVGRSK